ncbi:hypothetical protein C8R44DRAFT_776102 [Mycena epipterygia]|nr:hypothetical protein C8R44DRAFT_776102 [Mycena epipterygia]
MSPRCSISAFPVELISEIFLHCMPDEQDGLKAHIFSTSYTPISMLLSNICSLWRDIALSTPALWSTLYLDLDKSPSQILMSKKKFKKVIKC